MTNWPNLVPIILVERVIARSGERECELAATQRKDREAGGDPEHQRHLEAALAQHIRKPGFASVSYRHLVYSPCHCILFGRPKVIRPSRGEE